VLVGPVVGVAGIDVGVDTGVVVATGGVVFGGADGVGDAVCDAGWVVGGIVVGRVLCTTADDEGTVPTLVPDELGLAGVDPTVALGVPDVVADCVVPT
jgi:hypothetical protein